MIIHDNYIYSGLERVCSWTKDVDWTSNNGGKPQSMFGSCWGVAMFIQSLDRFKRETGQFLRSPGLLHVFSFIHPSEVKKILWLTTKQHMSSTSHPLWQQSKRVWAVPCAPTTKWTASIPAPTATFWMMFWNLDWLSQKFFRSCFPVSRFGIYREDLC